MNFLGFTLSVWAAIAFGIFFLAMVLACTADRNHKEGPKWVFLLIGIAAVTFWQWDSLSWGFFVSAAFWKPFGIYLLIGLAYSFAEFFFQLRREARDWSKRWKRFKDQPNRGQEQGNRNLEAIFVEEAKKEYRYETALVQVGLDGKGNIAPTVNRKELAEAIGCWTLFWPAYAVSLVLGDFLTELCRGFANLVAMLSTGLVRRMFAKTFER